MITNFKQILDDARTLGEITIAVAVAQDRAVLEAVKEANTLGLINAILVGDEYQIKPVFDELGLDNCSEIIHEPNIEKAASTAVKKVHDGEAQILMKGYINSHILLKAALAKDDGLRSSRLLSHLAAYEIPGAKKLIFNTDGGINIAPSLDDKKQILMNAVDVLHRLGIEKPNVAVLSANELVCSSMKATVDAAELVKMWRKNELGNCIVEGPVAMDVVASPEAARLKGIESKISGNVDLLLAPSIEVGNIIGKTLVYYAGAKISGVVIGATNPIVMVSRSNNAEAKLNSIALACLLSDR